METGFWSAWAPSTLTAGAEVLGTISFPVPLSGPLTAQHVVYLNTANSLSPPTGPCRGGNINAPSAAPGYLCVYTGAVEERSAQGFVAVRSLTGVTGASAHGAVVALQARSSGPWIPISGSWAVAAG